jgi:6-pyruvoyltetrahydropterin/6-carboxytetrahydropterin synthase
VPYRICKCIEIESGHQLSKHPAVCRFPHGHTRRVEFVLEADELDDHDMVCDFKIIKETIGSHLEGLDHALCVNTADPMYATLKQAYGDRVVGFENQDPTTEVIAKTIHDVFAERLEAYRRQPDSRFPIRSSVRIISVRVWETSSSWAEYIPPTA